MPTPAPAVRLLRLPAEVGLLPGAKAAAAHASSSPLPRAPPAPPPTPPPTLTAPPTPTPPPTPLPSSSPALATAQYLGFVGDGRTATNYLGLQRFLREGWPELRRRWPRARLRVAGRAPSGHVAGARGTDEPGEANCSAGRPHCGWCRTLSLRTLSQSRTRSLSRTLSLSRSLPLTKVLGHAVCGRPRTLRRGHAGLPADGAAAARGGDVASAARARLRHHRGTLTLTLSLSLTLTLTLIVTRPTPRCCSACSSGCPSCPRPLRPPRLACTRPRTAPRSERLPPSSPPPPPPCSPTARRARGSARRRCADLMGCSAATQHGHKRARRGDSARAVPVPPRGPQRRLPPPPHSRSQPRPCPRHPSPLTPTLALTPSLILHSTS